MSAGFDSPSSLTRAKDSELLAVIGVGPAIVSAIRRECHTASQPNARFMDRVIR
jgi:hypothetical protein